MSHWIQRVGQSDGDTFASLISKLGNNTATFWAAIGYEGATSLAAKITAARAGYLDELDFDLNARLGTPAGASLAADLLTIDNLVDDLESRLGTPAGGDVAANIGNPAAHTLTSLVAKLGNLARSLTVILGTRWDVASDVGTDIAQLLTYTDILDDATNGLANIKTLVDDLEGRLTALRAGYLDNLSAGAVALASVSTEARLAELDAINLPADIDLIKGYTDSLEGAVGAIEGATTLHNKLTAARAALLDQMTAVRMAELDAANIPADIDTVLTRLTAARAGYLDFLDTTETAGPYSYTDAGGEQDVVEDTAVTRRHISLSFSNRNMANTGTFKLYVKEDGTNYDLYISQPVAVVAGSERRFDIQFTLNQSWKLTYTEDSDEGGAKNIPFNVITQGVE